MENAVKRIGVLTSGGDAPGMNAAVRAVVRAATFRGIECIGIRRGYTGLINGDFMKLTTDNVSHIINRGGTMLYTARCEEFRTVEGQQKAAATCKLLGLGGIIGIGGDGTFRGLVELSKQGISVAGIPATIDNDIVCTDYTIGYDTAANTAVEAIDRLRDTMQSHERCSVVEVMGHNAGHLALYVGLATGATAVLVPEKGVDFERDVIDRIRQSRLAGNTHFMIIVAEGAGSGMEIGKVIHDVLGLDPRVTILGHIQRGGTPSARDRVMATRMGYHAVKVLAEGKTNRVICARNGGMMDLDILEGLAMKKGLNAQQYEVLEAMTAYYALNGTAFFLELAALCFVGCVSFALQFYAAMAAGASTKTSQVNADEFEAYFETFLQDGKDILHVCLSSGISGVLNSAMIAKADLEERYPERKILIVDSLGASSGYGLLMDRLADLRDEGKTLEEVYDFAMKNRLKVHHWFFSTDLTFYVRGGRISKASGAIGGLLGICPLLNMDNEGRLIPRFKIRTKKKVIKKIVDQMEENAEGGLSYSGKCYISQSACYEDARAVADLIEERFPNLNGKVEINNIGTTIGSHTGPGTVALFFWGKERVV